MDVQQIQESIEQINKRIEDGNISENLEIALINEKAALTYEKAALISRLPVSGKFLFLLYLASYTTSRLALSTLRRILFCCRFN